MRARARARRRRGRQRPLHGGSMPDLAMSRSRSLTPTVSSGTSPCSPTADRGQSHQTGPPTGAPPLPKTNKMKMRVTQRGMCRVARRRRAAHLEHHAARLDRPLLALEQVAAPLDLLPERLARVALAAVRDQLLEARVRLRPRPAQRSAAQRRRTCHARRIGSRGCDSRNEPRGAAHRGLVAMPVDQGAHELQQLPARSDPRHLDPEQRVHRLRSSKRPARRERAPRCHRCCCRRRLRAWRRRAPGTPGPPRGGGGRRARRRAPAGSAGAAAARPPPTSQPAAGAGRTLAPARRRHGRTDARTGDVARVGARRRMRMRTSSARSKSCMRLSATSTEV
eukprot:scaffold1889_cov268-Prasinococcus_capsulatus_cf.AAC.2